MYNHKAKGKSFFKLIPASNLISYHFLSFFFHDRGKRMIAAGRVGVNEKDPRVLCKLPSGLGAAW